MTNPEMFETNYNSLKLRDDFANITGLNTDAEPAAYIAFLNCMASISISIFLYLAS